EFGVKAVRPWIRLGPVITDGGQVNAADELGNVLGFGVRGYECANPQTFFFRVKETLDGHTINVALVLFAEMQRTQRAQLALDMNARFRLKILAQGMGHEIQGVFVLWAVRNSVHRALIGLCVDLEPTFEQ